MTRFVSKHSRPWLNIGQYNAYREPIYKENLLIHAEYDSCVYECNISDEELIEVYLEYISKEKEDIKKIIENVYDLPIPLIRIITEYENLLPYRIELLQKTYVV